jgi:anaerobic ribonucleoside-triphosphate reductase activating protein
MTPLPSSDPVLNLASIVERTEAEGPGARFAVWAQGCRIGCADCCNPHLWSHEPAQTWRVSALLERIRAARVRHPDLEGVTLIGGEPFEQDTALAPLARALRADGLSVLAFTGHLLEELQERGSPLLTEVDLLVDGPYVQALRTTTRRWIGSTNQRLHFLSDAYQPDDPRFAEPNTAEIRLNGEGEIQVVGFPFDSVREAFGPKAWKRLKAAERASS